MSNNVIQDITCKIPQSIKQKGSYYVSIIFAEDKEKDILFLKAPRYQFIKSKKVI